MAVVVASEGDGCAAYAAPHALPIAVCLALILGQPHGVS